MGSVGLLYVGAVLAINGLMLLGFVEARAAAPLNLFVGALQVVTPTFLIFTAGGDEATILAASGLYLFGFTYLYVGINLLAGLDGTGLGWFSAFVALGRRGLRRAELLLRLAAGSRLRRHLALLGRSLGTVLVDPRPPAGGVHAVHGRGRGGCGRRHRRHPGVPAVDGAVGGQREPVGRGARRGRGGIAAAAHPAAHTLDGCPPSSRESRTRGGRRCAWPSRFWRPRMRAGARGPGCGDRGGGCRLPTSAAGAGPGRAGSRSRWAASWERRRATGCPWRCPMRPRSSRCPPGWSTPAAAS